MDGSTRCSANSKPTARPARGRPRWTFPWPLACASSKNRREHRADRSAIEAGNPIRSAFIESSHRHLLRLLATPLLRLDHPHFQSHSGRPRRPISAECGIAVARPNPGMGAHRCDAASVLGNAAISQRLGRLQRIPCPGQPCSGPRVKIRANRLVSRVIDHVFRVASGEDRGPRRRAGGRVRHRVGEAHALSRKAVKMRRSHVLHPGAAEGGGPLLVGEDEDDVGMFRHDANSTRRQRCPR